MNISRVFRSDDLCPIPTPCQITVSTFENFIVWVSLLAPRRNIRHLTLVLRLSEWTALHPIVDVQVVPTGKPSTPVYLIVNDFENPAFERDAHMPAALIGAKDLGYQVYNVASNNIAAATIRSRLPASALHEYDFPASMGRQLVWSME